MLRGVSSHFLLTKRWSGGKKKQSRCLSGAANAGGSLFLNAAERLRSDGLNTSGPFISVIILQQYGQSHWRFVWYKLYSRWYAVIRPFESPSVSAFLLTLSSSLPSLSLFCPHSSWRAAFRALHHSTWRAIKLLGNFCKDARQPSDFVTASHSIVTLNRWIARWPNHALTLRYKEIIHAKSSRRFFFLCVRFCPFFVTRRWHFFFCPAEELQPLSGHPSYDMPPRYDVTVTLSYAVEFIVCTAADYRCLTCHTGDLKRQQTSLRCILLARWKAWGMLGCLVLKHGFQCSGGTYSTGGVSWRGLIRTVAMLWWLLAWSVLVSNLPKTPCCTICMKIWTYAGEYSQIIGVTVTQGRVPSLEMPQSDRALGLQSSRNFQNLETFHGTLWE